MRADIEADQAMLIQFAEEKMAIGNQCYDLITHHLSSLDREMQAFENDLQVCVLRMLCARRPPPPPLTHTLVSTPILQ